MKIKNNKIGFSHFPQLLNENNNFRTCGMNAWIEVLILVAFKRLPYAKLKRSAHITKSENYRESHHLLIIFTFRSR